LPDAWNDGGIFAASYADAYGALRALSLEERIGQTILTRVPREGAFEAIRDFHVGGLLLVKADFADRTKAQVVDMIAAYQRASDLPMVMAVDEEGGGVVRVSCHPLLSDHPYLSPHALYAAGGLDAIRADAALKAKLLLSLGLNLNLAPVADVSLDPSDYIHGRTLGRAAPETGRFVAAVTDVSQAAGLSSTLKHFPGYGDNPDTHTGLATDPRPFATFRTSDFLPFQAGIDAGAECVMVSHLTVTCMDPDHPASLSPEVHRILREDLGFTGLILTDSLGMGGVTHLGTGKDPAVQALLAGNDVLVVPDYRTAFESVRLAVLEGVVPREVLDRAAFRVLAWKYACGLIGTAGPSD
jgi:beta-N-acetylhexosaminidase